MIAYVLKELAQLMGQYYEEKGMEDKGKLAREAEEIEEWLKYQTYRNLILKTTIVITVVVITATSLFYNLGTQR